MRIVIRDAEAGWLSARCFVETECRSNAAGRAFICDAGRRSMRGMTLTEGEDLRPEATFSLLQWSIVQTHNIRTLREDLIQSAEGRSGA